MRKPLVILRASAEASTSHLSPEEKFLYREVRVKMQVEPKLHRVLKVCFVSSAVWKGVVLRLLLCS